MKSIQLFAQETTCLVNNEPVKCDDVVLSTADYIFGGPPILLFAFAAFVALGVIWIFALIHLLNNNVKNRGMWAIILPFTYGVGAAFYYWGAVRPFNKEHPRIGTLKDKPKVHPSNATATPDQYLGEQQTSSKQVSEQLNAQEIPQQPQEAAQSLEPTQQQVSAPPPETLENPDNTQSYSSPPGQYPQ